jgi:hypothetical protein
MDVLKHNLSEIIGYIKYKVDNDLCTPEEIESVSKMAMENLKLYGTIEDMAKFYNVPESKVRNTINRKMIEKPKRRVYYRFLSFLKIVPNKWRNS